MPQMSSMDWLMLLSYFMFIFYLFMILIYFLIKFVTSSKVKDLKSAGGYTLKWY